MSSCEMTLSYALDLFSYDSDEGILRWNVNRGKVRIGDIAGMIERQGYYVVGVDGRLYFAHRLVWLISYGHWPDGLIDHINGVRSDNRLVNIREVSAFDNSKNMRLSRRNTSGAKCVFWNKRDRLWKVQISNNGKIHYGGCFHRFDDAKEAARKLREKLHGEFTNHG